MKSAQARAAAWLGVPAELLDAVPSPVVEAILSRASQSPSFADPLHNELLEHMRASIAKLRSDAYIDPLTRLPNRAAIEEHLEIELERAQLVGTTVALLLADVDDFKAVNDELGHLIGDQVLRTVASRLRSAMRGGDTVGRWGGDEFVILCPGAHDANIEQIAAHVREAVSSEPVAADGSTLTVNVSIGCAVSAIATFEELIATADAAMYRNKAGRHSPRTVEAPR
jgi:diguanylate cyclase (GGDEF)-like protein